MKAVVTLEITIDDEACEAAGITGEDIIKNRLTVLAGQLPCCNGVCLVATGPEGHEIDPFIVDGRVITAIRTRFGRKREPAKQVE